MYRHHRNLQERILIYFNTYEKKITHRTATINTGNTLEKKMSTFNSFYSNYKAPVPKRKSNKNIIVTKPEVKETEPIIVVKKPLPKKENIVKKNIVKKKKYAIKSLRPPKKLIKKKRPVRPSLSEQLANIGAKASEVTENLREKHNLKSSSGEKPLYIAPSLKFVVGRLESKLPSPVEFFRDHVAYTFNHPYQNKQILMKMYYGHMSQKYFKKSMNTYVFEFKISHPLKHYGLDYDPGEHNHKVKIVFASEKDTLEAKKIMRMRC